MIQDGRYTLVYNGGEYRTVQIENITEEGHTFKGKTILSRKAGKRYQGIAFLASDNRVMLWKRFMGEFDQKRREALQNAVNRIARNPKEAGMAYAIAEGRCCRCGRELTVPASIHAGMGPDCAEKYAWAKEDNAAVHQVLAAIREKGSPYAGTDNRQDVPVQKSMEFPAVDATDRLHRAPNVEPMKPENIPAHIQHKVDMVTKQRNTVQNTAKAVDDHIARMVAFQKANDSKNFYDPFGIGENLNEAAAAHFWTKRFLSTPLEDDRFWGDEFGRLEAKQEREAFASDPDFREFSAQGGR